MSCLTRSPIGASLIILNSVSNAWHESTRSHALIAFSSSAVPAAVAFATAAVVGRVDSLGSTRHS